MRRIKDLLEVAPLEQIILAYQHLQNTIKTCLMN